MATNIGTAFFNVTFNTAAARREVTALVSNVNRQLGLVGGVAVVAGTAAIAGMVRTTYEIGTAALTAANEYEQAFASVRKTLDDGTLTAAQAETVFARLNTELRNLALDTPLDLEDDITQVAALGAQLGIAADDIVDFTKVISEVGVTTNIAVDDAATGFARLANIMNVPADDFRELGDALINLGNNLPAQEDEILRFSLRTAAAGEIVGFTADEVLSLSGAMASVGVPAERGGTAIQRTMIKIEQAVAGGTEAVAGFAEVSGLTGQEFIDLWERDASEAFTVFVEGLGRAGSSAFSILSELELAEQRTLQALLSIANAGPLLRDSFEIGANSADALARESSIFFDTTEARIKLLQNAVNDAGITIGNEVQGPFRALLDGITEWINQNPVLIQQIGENLAGVLSGLAPIITTTIDLIANLTEAWTDFLASFDEPAVIEPGFFRPDVDSPVALPGMSAFQEFQDFLERGFAFDPTLVQIDRFFESFLPDSDLFVDSIEGSITLAEVTLRKALTEGASDVDALTAGFFRLQDALVEVGQDGSVTAVQFAELTDEFVKLSADELTQFAAQVGVENLSYQVRLLLGLVRTGTRVPRGRGAQTEQTPIPVLPDVDFETEEELAAAAEAAAAYADALAETRTALLETGLSSDIYLDNVQQLNPELATLVDETGRATFEFDLMKASLDNLRNVMEFRPAAEGLFGVGDLINGIELAKRTLEESGDEVLVHGRDFTAQVQENLNQIAEFEANLIILFAQGFDDLARLLAEQGPEFAHVAEDYATAVVDPAVVEAFLENGGTLGEKTQEGLDNALNAAGDNPALIEFAAQFGSQTVLQSVYQDGVQLGTNYGEGFRDGFLRIVGGLAGLLPEFELPPSITGGDAGEGVTNNEGGSTGGTGGSTPRQISITIPGTGVSTSDAARVAQLINTLTE